MVPKLRKIDSETEDPWRYMADLPYEYAGTMRRVMVLVHHKLNPTEKLDLASSLNWTYLTRKERQRVKEMLKESNNNDLLVEMLRWFSLQYRADDEEVVKVTDVLRKHVVNAVRQPRMYQVEYLKEREQWNEFIGKEDADMGGLGGLSTSPSRPSEFITSVTQAMADASLVDNQQKGQPFTSNPKAQLFAPRNLRKRPAAIPVVEGPFTSPSKRQSTSSLPKNQRRQARQAIANIPDLEIQSVTFKNYADRAAFLEASSFTSMGQRQGAANIPNAEAHSFTSMNQRKGTANIPVLQTPSFTSSTGRRRGVANNPGVEARSLTSSQQNGAARVPALETPSITSVNQPQRQAIIPVNNYDFTDEDASTVSDISSDDEVNIFAEVIPGSPKKTRSGRGFATFGSSQGSPKQVIGTASRGEKGKGTLPRVKGKPAKEDD